LVGRGAASPKNNYNVPSGGACAKRVGKCVAPPPPGRPRRPGDLYVPGVVAGGSSSDGGGTPPLRVARCSDNVQCECANGAGPGGGCLTVSSSLGVRHAAAGSPGGFREKRQQSY